MRGHEEHYFAATQNVRYWQILLRKSAMNGVWRLARIS